MSWLQDILRFFTENQAPFYIYSRKFPRHVLIEQTEYFPFKMRKIRKVLNLKPAYKTRADTPPLQYGFNIITIIIVIFFGFP